MKFNARHLLVILLVALLGCCMFTFNVVEGLTNNGGATDVPVDRQTLEPLPYPPLEGSRPIPAPTGGVSASPANFSGALDTLPPSGNVVAQSAQNDDVPMGEVTETGAQNVAPVSTALPKGIPFSEIPAGEEDLYIRKSEVVPPVCPACPSNVIPREKPCPACPPCARCPEPAFECKKVPSYATNSEGMQSSLVPRPVLADFSSFGM